MNLQYVKYALEISRTGSISKAAENLSVAQPNLSRAVKELESQLGISIFERTRTGMTVTPERQEVINFTASYATGVQVVIVTEDSAIASVDDLFADGAMHIIGVQRNTTGDLYSTWDLEDAGLASIDRYSKGADAVQALLTGKVDCVVIDNEPAKVFVANNPGLKILDTEYITEDYAIAVAKENKELTEKINVALAEIKADGTLDVQGSDLILNKQVHMLRKNIMNGKTSRDNKWDLYHI